MIDVFPPIEDYLRARGIHIDPYKSRGGHDRRWVRCPFHEPDDDPSFYFSQQKNVWRCPVCNLGGGVKRLICLLEFNGRDDRETWRAVSKRCEDLVGMAAAGSPGGGPSFPSSHIESREETRLSDGQLALLDKATLWWHERLFDPTRGPAQARDYLITRGVLCRTMAQPEIGYAPQDPDGGYASALIRVLACSQEEAVSLGLLSRREKDGRLSLRFQGRIMFSSRDEGGHTRYYQGRIVGSSPTSSTTRYKYLGAPLPKYPFSLSVEHPVIPGTIGTESPMGPLVLVSHDLAGMATCGAGIPSFVLTRFPAPFYWAQDHDTPKRRKVGPSHEEFSPGEEQANRTIAQCHFLGIQAYRLRPPLLYKGLDEWVASEGPLPLLEVIAVLGGESAQKGAKRGLSSG